MAFDKVVDSQALDGALGAVADAIRGKTGSAATLTLEQMPGAISGIQTGSGGVELPELENPGTVGDLMEGKQLIDGAGRVVDGTFTIAPELAEQAALIDQIRVAVQGKTVAAPVIQALEITENGVFTAPEGVDGYAPITVHVPVPEGYVKPAGELEITENGSYDVADYAAVSVAVAASGGDPKALLDAALNNTLTSIDSTVTNIVAYACRGLSKIKTVNLPDATSIGQYAFYYCTAMTSINAPKVTSLGTYAFYNCGALKTINFPLVSSVPAQSFYSCGALTKADFGAASSIAASAFAYCDKLTTLILRRTSGVCSLANNNALTDTPIEGGTGYVYVPAALIESYKTASRWSTYANQFRAIEDYPDVCG